MAIAKLALADGTLFIGSAFGARTVRGGEVVFNTAHTGYQEVITDPSYAGQIVCMTCPLQGNYGINPQDGESLRPFVEGFVVRELSAVASNYRSQQTLDELLKAHNVPGITDIDTRELTLKLRADGAINGLLATEDVDDDELLDRAAALPSMTGQDLVRQVASGEPFEWTQGFDDGIFSEYARNLPLDKHVVAIDSGTKHNIYRHLVDIGCKVTVVPPTTTPDEIKRLDPDGIFVSNGPGDPAAVTYLIETLRALTGDVPTFGICLGHQLLALGAGAETYKLKFGHHGYNHPVKNMLTGRVEITSQNHGFAVREQTLAPAGLEQTHINLYDGTVEGFRSRNLPLFAVQYHPEAAPGPHDAAYLFDCFRRMLESGRAPAAEEMAAAQETQSKRIPQRVAQDDAAS
jgi:carbamoyl-phosphate synthase small subunit